MTENRFCTNSRSFRKRQFWKIQTENSRNFQKSITNKRTLLPRIFPDKFIKIYLALSENVWKKIATLKSFLFIFWESSSFSLSSSEPSLSLKNYKIVDGWEKRVPTPGNECLIEVHFSKTPPPHFFRIFSTDTVR